MTVACGGCLGCRLDRSRTWAMRIVHEAQLYDDNCFVTLTYSPENLPKDGSLDKTHFQKFMKRLRKHFSPRKIRYYHCGEYGAELQRPHYHACLFNLHFPDQQLFQERDGNLLFVSETLNQLWPYGFSTIGDLTFESAAYCARYVLKKITGDQAHDHYLRWDENGEAYWLQPEYTTMSRRPGIGKDWYEKYKSDVFPSDEVPVPGSGVYKKAPRYYEQILEAEDPQTFEAIKEKRQQFRRENADEYAPDRLRSKYIIAKAKRDMLKRGLENET